MAQHLDLEEQEQLDQLKHLWAKYGNAITWLLILVLGGFAAWNGWQYWQRKTAVAAAALYDELDRAVQAQQPERVQRVWADLQDSAARSAQAAQGGLLAAKALYTAGKPDEARAALRFVVEHAADPATVAVARLRLAGLELDAKAPEQALKWLEAEWPASFKGLVADRRGDALLAKGDHAGARAAYQNAYTALAQQPDYRRLVEAKLNALGINPAAEPASTTEIQP